MNSSVNASGTSRATIVATVGFMCLGLTWWILSMSDAGWFDKIYPGGTAMLSVSLVLAIVAVLAFIEQRTLDAVIFFGGAAWFASLHAALTATGATSEPAHYDGWLGIVWTVYFFYLWLASLKGDTVRMLFLLGSWLSLLAFSLGSWGLGHVLIVIDGYIGLATGILAVIVSASAIINASSAGGGA